MSNQILQIILMPTGKSSEANADFLADLTVDSIKSVAEKVGTRMEG